MFLGEGRSTNSRPRVLTEDPGTWVRAIQGDLILSDRPRGSGATPKLPHLSVRETKTSTRAGPSISSMAGPQYGGCHSRIAIAVAWFIPAHCLKYSGLSSKVFRCFFFGDPSVAWRKKNPVFLQRSADESQKPTFRSFFNSLEKVVRKSCVFEPKPPRNPRKRSTGIL